MLGVSLSPLKSYGRTIWQFSPVAKLFLLNNLIAGTGFAVYQLLFNLYMVEIGYKADFIGLLNALPTLAMIFAALPVGLASDRWGRQRAILFGAVLEIISLGLSVTFPEKHLLMVLYVTGGLAASLINIGAMPFLLDNSKSEERTHLFSIWATVNTVTAVFGSIIGGALPSLISNSYKINNEATAYRLAISAGIALMISGIVPLVIINRLKNKAKVEERKTDSKEKAPPSWKVLLQPKQFFSRPGVVTRIQLPNFIFACGAGLMIPFLNLFFHEAYHASSATIGLIFAPSWFVTSIGCLSAPLLARKLGPVKAVLLLQSLSIPFMLMIGFSGNIWAAALAFLIRGTLMNMVNPIYVAYTIEFVPEGERARISSIESLGWSIGWTVSQYISGIVQVRWGFAPLFVANSLIYLLATITTYSFFGRGQRYDQESTELRHKELKLAGAVGD